MEATDFDSRSEQASYRGFIDAPFDELIHSGTRFWDASGVSLSTSAEGIGLRLDSLDTLLIGGVSFGSYPGMDRGSPVESGTEFRLYASYGEIVGDPYRIRSRYVVTFDQSVAGLVPDAPVTYRGIRIGTVERILLAELDPSEMTALEGRRDIPVLINIEPGRLKLPDVTASGALLHDALVTGIANGLRATLQTGNLLTGRKEISLDYLAPGGGALDGLDRFGDYEVIASVQSGVGSIAVQVNELLTGINALPLGQTGLGLNRTLAKMESALATLDTGISSINALVSSPATQQLPTELDSALRELRTVLANLGGDPEAVASFNASLAKLDRTLANLDQSTRELSERPSAVLFGPTKVADPEPEARR